MERNSFSLVSFFSWSVLLVIRSRHTSGLTATPLKNTKAVVVTINNIKENIYAYIYTYIYIFKGFYKTLTKSDVVGRCYRAGVPINSHFSR